MSITKRDPVYRNIEEWTSVAHVQFKQQIITFILWAYGFLLLATMTIFFLQGFRVGQFSLDVSLLRWLGGATIGEIGCLLALIFRASFK